MIFINLVHRKGGVQAGNDDGETDSGVRGPSGVKGGKVIITTLICEGMFLYASSQSTKPQNPSNKDKVSFNIYIFLYMEFI